MFDLKAIRIKCRANQLGEIGFFELVFLASCLDARKVQDIIDEGCEPLAFLANDAEILLIFFLCGEPPELLGFGVKPD